MSHRLYWKRPTTEYIATFIRNSMEAKNINQIFKSRCFPLKKKVKNISHSCKGTSSLWDLEIFKNHQIDMVYSLESLKLESQISPCRIPEIFGWKKLWERHQRLQWTLQFKTSLLSVRHFGAVLYHQLHFHHKYMIVATLPVQPLVPTLNSRQ